MNPSLFASLTGSPSAALFSSLRWCGFVNPTRVQCDRWPKSLQFRGEYKLQTSVVTVESLGAGKNRLVRRGNQGTTRDRMPESG
jgi:hypothetical protein